MFALLRSCLLRSIALLVVLLPMSMVLSHLPFSQWKSSMTTFLAFAHPAATTHPAGMAHPADIKPVPRPMIPLSGTSVLGGPSLSAAFVNQVLKAAGSPAAGTGQALHDLSASWGIDDAYALAVFQKESSLGRAGAGFANHSLGNSICAGYPTCNGRFRSYGSWQEGYNDFYRLIAREYVSRGLTTVETITPVYAPSVENNTELYIQQVRQSILAFRRAQYEMSSR